MTTTKIKIDLNNGIIDAEGAESFVLGIYADFKEQIAAVRNISTGKYQGGNEMKVRKKKKIPGKVISKTNTKKKMAGEAAGKLAKDLDLSGKGGKLNLRDYYSQYNAKTNLERNLIFSYYLQNELGMGSFGIDEIFTCYRNIQNLKIPGNLKQSLYDTSVKGWIKISSIESGISVSVSGMNHIEHDLERNEK